MMARTASPGYACAGAPRPSVKQKCWTGIHHRWMMARPAFPQTGGSRHNGLAATAARGCSKNRRLVPDHDAACSRIAGPANHPLCMYVGQSQRRRQHRRNHAASKGSQATPHPPLSVDPQPVTIATRNRPFRSSTSLLTWVLSRRLQTAAPEYPDARPRHDALPRARSSNAQRGPSDGAPRELHSSDGTGRLRPTSSPSLLAM